MLGLPTTSSFIELRPEYDTQVVSHGFFVHDDWRFNERLTLNLGIRYDLELGMTESDDRNIGPFDLTTTNPIEAQAQARFAANPPAGVPISASCLPLWSSRASVVATAFSEASATTNRRSVRWATTAVVPDPQNQSATRSPGADVAPRMRAISRSGFWVG